MRTQHRIKCFNRWPKCRISAPQLGAQMRNDLGPFPRGDGVFIPTNPECIITTMFVSNYVGNVRRHVLLPLVHSKNKAISTTLLSNSVYKNSSHCHKSNFCPVVEQHLSTPKMLSELLAKFVFNQYSIMCCCQMQNFFCYELVTRKHVEFLNKQSDV